LTHDVSGLIRVAEERDAQAIAGIYAPAITDAVISFELTPPDAGEISRRMLAIQRQYPWLVYEESKTVLGYFEILVIQGYRTACAGITLPNTASVQMHAAMGFKLVGVYHDVGYKFGKWHDVGWYERTLAEHVPEPPEPVPFPELAGSSPVKAAFARGADLVKST
jgi:phosphinothricin acetyltransferase